MILATVSHDPAFHGDVRAALDSRFRFDASYGVGYDDARRLHGVESDQKCLIILDFSQAERALPLARILNARPNTTTIAVGCTGNWDELLPLMQAGIRDVLKQFTAGELVEAVNRALAVLDSGNEILGDTYAFMPAKPGCGATTVATYVAGFASRLRSEPTLLLDFDYRLGITTFLLKAEGTRTIADALGLVQRMDRDLWASLVTQIGSLHLLGSCAADYSRRYSAEKFRELLDFAVRQYSSVVVDLPGTMEDYECDVLLRAKRILLVSTPDIGSLHVARRKAQWLQEMRLLDKVSVVMNCIDRRNAFSVKQLEDVTQLPVRYLLPSSVNEIARAVHRGEILNADCPLGIELNALAREFMAGDTVIKKPSPVRRFVEYFSVSPARDRQTA